MRWPSKQCLDDNTPLIVETASFGRSARVAVPITRVRQITFTTVEVRVHPGGIGPLDGLRDLVCACPVAAPLMPESLRERMNVRWRGRFAQRGFEGSQRHTNEE